MGPSMGGECLPMLTKLDELWAIWETECGIKGCSDDIPPGRKNV